VHLKTLTLRGFKSFASATTLNFEPGITCVVGPNGSGKSNVVDALAWVLGEQGAKSLRGGKMEDVIFAGTSGRAPLGRAEVAVTIDNSDGKLPIDYSEVTLSRTLFRNGGSEYAINGSPVRLLDIQELLSDSGIGREMHVIIGQGQLDAVLHATPEERRGFIEEAAGVLKHRKRKEKALRKLDAMQGNLTRLTDLISEIRRQLGPLGKQAEVARRAQVIQHQLRDAGARLLADDYAQLSATFEQDVADERAVKERQKSVATALDARRQELASAEEAAAGISQAHAQSNELWYRTSSLRERVRSTISLAAERSRLLGTTDSESANHRDIEQLEQQLQRVSATLEELQDEVVQAKERLSAAEDDRKEAEAQVHDEQNRVAQLQRVAADRREGLARLTGAVGEQRSRVEATEAEIGRLQERLTEVKKRQSSAQLEFTALEGTVAGVEEGEEDLDAEYERAAESLEAETEELRALEEQHAAANTDRARWQARKEALNMSLLRKDGAGALLELREELPAILGSVAALLTIEPGSENAIAAALGSQADAVAVRDLGGAIDGIRRLRDDDAGRAEFLIGSDTLEPEEPWVPPAGLPEDVYAAAAVVTAPPEIRSAVNKALTAVVVVPDLVIAQQVISRHPDLIAATLDGDLIAGAHATGGAHGSPSVLELQAAYDEAAAQLDDAVQRSDKAAFALEAIRERKAAAAQRAEKILEQLHQSDAKLAAVAEQLGTLGSQVRAAQAEADRITEHIATAQERLTTEQSELAQRVERLRAVEATSESQQTEAQDVDEAQLEELNRIAAQKRAAEMDARLNLRTVEERERAQNGRKQSLQRTILTEREARQRAQERARKRQAQAEVAHVVTEAGGELLTQVERALERAADEREQLATQRAQSDEQINSLRKTIDELAAEMAQLTDAVHRDEVARTQQRLQIEQLQQRALDEYGMTSDDLLSEYGPDVLVPADPVPELEAEEQPEPAPYVRGDQEKRLRKAQRAMSLLGRVNPLALEEFSALEERHKFLSEQLQDLKKSREDLLSIVAEIDDRVEKVFAAAYADTAQQFEGVFSRLFPGGEGRLVLTDPDNMLTTGIEVEARPAGKKVKRLSLLSGGERSLTAVAILVAIFKARPSPFYVLDEVEAALDDVNLGRLIELFKELRDNSQLLIITHQKRTMEVADALYGVTMRGDGVTTVISQRLQEEAPAQAETTQ